MIEINGKQFCENCFETITGAVCPACGFNPADSVSDPLTLAPGSVLMNRYVVGRVIGKGGFGITYLAYDALTRKKIAVKEYFPYGLAQRATGSIEVSVTSENSADTFRIGAEKFYNEAKLVSRFNGNPNIVAVYDCFYENDTVYMAMEYLRGSTLKDYIREHGILSAPQALFVANSINNALVVAHSASVLHRDISPDNVMLCDNGDIKLIDFGSARQLVAERSQAFSVILKPGFAPPEQYSKKGNQGSWTDVYSLGTTLYFMLTGDIPEDPTARFDDDDTFKENQFDIEPTLWEVITKATKLKIEERYADSYELKNALKRVSINPEPPIAQSETFAEGAAFPSESTGSTANMKVSIKMPRHKHSFFRRHLRTFIEVTCGLLAAALVIPLAVKVYRPAAGDNTSASDPSGDNRVAAIGTTIDVEELGYKFKWPNYSILDNTEKELYALIFLGLNTNEKNIVVPSLTYNVPTVEEIFKYVLYDNPHLNHARGFNVNYSDLNNNKEPDDDEYITAILPNYTGIDPHEANDYMNKAASAKALDEDSIASLRYFHDKLIEETKIVIRNSNPTASTTHGAVIENRADEIGLAKAMCGYAQRLGYYAYVTDQKTTSNGTIHAWVRLKIDGAWYNIDPYYDSLMNSVISSIPVSDNISHYCFLMGDKAYFGDVDVSEIVSDEKFYPLYSSDSGEVSPNENFYVEKYLGKAYYQAVDSAYSAIIEETQNQLGNGGEIVSVCVSPDIVNDLWATMNESYISDLAGKGVTISEFTAEYSDDSINITLKK